MASKDQKFPPQSQLTQPGKQHVMKTIPECSSPDSKPANKPQVGKSGISDRRWHVDGSNSEGDETRIKVEIWVSTFFLSATSAAVARPVFSMDTLSVAQLLPRKPSPSCFLLHSQKHGLRFLSSFSISRTNCEICLTSKFRASKAVLNPPSSITHEAETKSNTPTLRELCEAHVPQYILDRMEEIGFVMPTDVQLQALPHLFSGRDCILHAQTGSGKTLTYLLLIYSIINTTKSAVQALIVVPTRELGMQVTKVARILAAKPTELQGEQKSCTIMALLDGGTLRRHKSWIKADPPTIVVATMGSLCQMLERQVFKLETVRVLIVDEVDFIFNSSKQVSSIRKLLTSYSSCNNRQTVFASASIPQHRRFVHDCVQQKWTKRDVIHIHVSSVEPMPSRLCHRFTVCRNDRKQQTLLSLIHSDAPESGIIFVGEQSEKSKRAGNVPSTSLVIDFLKASYQGSLDILLLEEDMNFNSRATSLLDLKKGGGYLLVATDIAARGVDLPEMSHIYNFDLPRTAIDYLHRAGRTCRKPFSDMKCTVTTIIVREERFVLQKYENELMFNCEELVL